MDIDDDDPSPAERTGKLTEATCWECGVEKQCFEFVVCCTGTLFHVCPECIESKTAAAAPSCATPVADAKSSED